MRRKAINPFEWILWLPPVLEETKRRRRLAARDLLYVEAPCERRRRAARR